MIMIIAHHTHNIVGTRELGHAYFLVVLKNYNSSIKVDLFG